VLNPLTAVQRDGKKVRICVNASKINRCIVPNHESTAPLQELLQKFNGTQYMTSLDLPAAYLQAKLHEDPRKYTAFLFDSNVYQFKRVPFGFKKSLSAFIGDLELTLGNGPEAGHGGRAIEGMHCLRSLGSRDRGFESHSGHGCLVLVFVCVFLCLCTGRGLATS
jgi:hypothetical protein